MKSLIVALALVTPLTCALAHDTLPDAEAHHYRYGERIDVDEVISQDVVVQADKAQGLETVKLVYRDHAGLEHGLYYERVAESRQDN